MVSNLGDTTNNTETNLVKFIFYIDLPEYQNQRWPSDRQCRILQINGTCVACSLRIQKTIKIVTTKTTRFWISQNSRHNKSAAQSKPSIQLAQARDVILILNHTCAIFAGYPYKTCLLVIEPSGITAKLSNSSRCCLRNRLNKLLLIQKTASSVLRGIQWCYITT